MIRLTALCMLIKRCIMVEITHQICTFFLTIWTDCKYLMAIIFVNSPHGHTCHHRCFYNDVADILNSYICCSSLTVFLSVNSILVHVHILVNISIYIFEPPHGKTNNVVLNKSDTNRPVQAQKRARSLKFWV